MFCISEELVNECNKRLPKDMLEVIGRFEAGRSACIYANDN